MGDLVLTQTLLPVNNAIQLWTGKMGGGSKSSETSLNRFKRVFDKDVKDLMCYSDRARTKWNKKVNGGTLVIRISDNEIFRSTIGYKCDST